MTIAHAVVATVGAALLGQTPNAPDAPDLPHEFHAPKTECTMALPPGWTTAEPMPDHIAELLLPRADGGFARPAGIVRERPESPLSAAVSGVRERTRASWGRDPNFALAVDRPLTGAAVPARLLVHRFKEGAGLPVVSHYSLLFEFDRVVVELSSASNVGEEELVALGRSLRCKPIHPARSP